MTAKMRFEFFGTGTSQGVPEILCDCKVCQSDDPRDKRLRCSVWLQFDGLDFVVDVTPDFRQQCLRSDIKKIDALFLTHLHADHCFGLDDVRKFNRIQEKSIPIYLPAHMEDDFRSMFAYCLEDHPAGLFRPRFDLQLIDLDPVTYGDLTIHPLKVNHGEIFIRDFLFEAHGKRIAYLTDCHHVMPESLDKVIGSDIVILDALWKKDWEHYGHLNLSQALEYAEVLQGKETWFTHITHFMGCHAETSKELPENIKLAWDGLVLEL